MPSDPKPAPPPPPEDTIPARKAAIGDTYDPLTAARRLLAAGYDEPCLRMVVKGELL